MICRRTDRAGPGRAALAGGLAALAMASPAAAHHSFAMFDRTKEVSIDGTVKEWQFSNPHAYLQMVAAGGDAAAAPAREWSLETTAISGLLHKGMRRDTFHPGDKVKVIMHPLRNGAAGGELVSVTTADGMVWKLY